MKLKRPPALSRRPSVLPNSSNRHTTSPTVSDTRQVIDAHTGNGLLRFNVAWGWLIFNPSPSARLSNVDRRRSPRNASCRA